MSEFQKAAESIVAELQPFILKWDDVNAIEPQKFIANLLHSYYGDLASTYAKLVELAVCNQEMQKKDGKWLRSAKRISELLADPQVQAAIGGKDES